MEKIVSREGQVSPLDRANVDTDAIIPKQFLKSIKRSGYGPNLFDAWRYLDHGEPGMDCSKRALNPDFILNQPRYRGAQILLARENFGCGSSREHAPWALAAWGIRAILSTSFADIFRNNSLKNGVLPIVVDKATHQRLIALVTADPDAALTIDLAEQGVLLPDGTTVDFDIDPFAKRMLLAGTDEMGYLLSKEGDIAAWEAGHPARIETRASA